MDTISTLYPSLDERRPLPAYLTPLCLALSVLPFLVDNKRPAVITTSPLLLYLCSSWPCNTTGDPSSDYYNNSHFVAIPLWYIDFVLLTHRDGPDAPALCADPMASKSEGQRWSGLTTLTQRCKWAARLMLPAHRGIGWNWQVKGVPSDPYVHMSKWKYVRKHLGWSIFYYLQSVAALFILGFSYSMKQSLTHGLFTKALVDVLVGWSGAMWVWDRLNCAYSLAAAVSVAISISETWEWPPLMGSLRLAWSVRQMWRYVSLQCKSTQPNILQCHLPPNVQEGESLLRIGCTH